MPQLSIAGPGAVLDLGDKHRLDEDGGFPPQDDGRRFRHHPLEQLPQLARKLIRPAGSAAADIDELVTLPRGQQQTADRAGTVDGSKPTITKLSRLVQVIFRHESFRPER